jgi:hypothetical protein
LRDALPRWEETENTMKVAQVNMTVADYCAALGRREVVIDKTYQRSNEVWPLQARSYLIETILRGFPIPKLTLHQRTDLRSKRTIKYVVDGQQRTQALLDFYSGQLRLSRTIDTKDARNAVYEGLPEDLQGTFLSYSIDFDQFEAASEDDVREYYRRINSFTAPLTAEEKRHARYQGEMKWFIHRLTEVYENPLVNMGTITAKSAVRMSAAKLLAELVHAMIYGVTTTSTTTLDKMYGSFDRMHSFPQAEEIKGVLDKALSTALGFEFIAGTALTRGHMFYSLVIALMRVQSAWPTFDLSVLKARKISSSARTQLLRLADAYENPYAYPTLADFINSASEKTNVKSQRELRASYMAAALTGSLAG